MKMPTLKEILDSNSEVILDSGVERKSDFLWNIFELKNYSHLNLKDIEGEISSYQRFLEVLEHPNARTTSEITQEIRTHAEKLGEKTSYLRISKKNNGHRIKGQIKNCKKRNKVKRRRNLMDGSQKNLLNQELLEFLQRRVFHAYQVSRSKELEITDSNYKTFAEVIIHIERWLHLKQDTGYFLGRHDKDRAHDSDTDEKITATVLWQSMFSNKSPVLVTRDQDFIRLFGNIPGILGSDVFLPYNQEFRKRVNENPFQLYYSKGYTQGDYQLQLNNTPIAFLSEFKSIVSSRRIDEESEREIGKFWEQFCQSKPLHSSQY